MTVVQIGDPRRMEASLITNADEGRQPYTIVRTSDTRTALQLGLKQYLEQLSINFFGRELALKKVRQTWAEPEDDAEFPCAGVYSEEDGMYGDEDGMNTQLSAGMMNPSMKIDGVEGAYAVSPCELVQTFKLQVWTTDPKERAALCAMLEDALVPVPWMYGFRLRLPFYHNAAATYEPLSSIYEDSDEDARRRFRKVTFRIKAKVPLIRVFTGIKTAGSPGARVSIGIAISEMPSNVPTGLTQPAEDLCKVATITTSLA